MEWQSLIIDIGTAPIDSDLEYLHNQHLLRVNSPTPAFLTVDATNIEQNAQYLVPLKLSS